MVEVVPPPGASRNEDLNDGDDGIHHVNLFKKDNLAQRVLDTVFYSNHQEVAEGEQHVALARHDVIAVIVHGAPNFFVKKLLTLLSILAKFFSHLHQKKIDTTGAAVNAMLESSQQHLCRGPTDAKGFSRQNSRRRRRVSWNGLGLAAVASEKRFLGSCNSRKLRRRR